VWTSSPRNVLLPQTKPVVRTPGQRRTEVEMTLNVLDILKWKQIIRKREKERKTERTGLEFGKLSYTKHKKS